SSGHTVSKAARRRVELVAFQTHGPWVPQDQQQLPEIRQAGAKPSVQDDGSDPARRDEARSGALVLQPRGAIDLPSARSGGHVVIVAARTGGDIAADRPRGKLCRIGGGVAVPVRSGT